MNNGAADTPSFPIFRVITTMRILVLVSALATIAALPACSSTSQMTYLPNGDVGFAINCSGSDATSTWAQCYESAGKACGAYGYEVISKDEDKGATSGGTALGLFGANVRNRSLVVRCKR
jgi:hypothetical protein